MRDRLSSARSLALLCTALLGGLALAAPACSNDEPLDEAAFCRDYAARECESLAVKCSRETASCLEIRREVCRAEAARVKQLGRSFVPGHAPACLTQVRAAYTMLPIDAADFVQLRSRCERVFEGPAGANQPCAEDADCKSGLICDKRRCGVLQLVPAGANCGNPGERCPAGQFCRLGDGFLACAPRGPTGQTCATSEECADGLRCRGAACIAKLALDAQCSQDDDCLSGYCDPHTPVGVPRSCARGLDFARFTPSCDAFFGVPAVTQTHPEAGAGD